MKWHGTLQGQRPGNIPAHGNAMGNGLFPLVLDRVEVLATGEGMSNIDTGDRCAVEPYINCGMWRRFPTAMPIFPCFQGGRAVGTQDAGAGRSGHGLRRETPQPRAGDQGDDPGCLRPIMTRAM